MKKAAFIIDCEGSAYHINAARIQQRFGAVLDIAVITLDEAPRRDLPSFDHLFVLAWWNDVLYPDLLPEKDLKAKCTAIVGGHIHIERGKASLLHNYASTLCVSDRLSAALEAIGIRSDVIRYFYRSDYFHPANRKPRSGGKFRIGWAGRPDRAVKRYSVFKAAAASLADQVEAKTAFSAFDKDADGRLTFSHDLNQRQMGDFYRGLDLFVVTSKSEGHPKPAVEAALCATPVLGSDVGVLPQLGAIILPEPLTAAVLSRAVGEIARKPAGELQLLGQTMCGNANKLWAEPVSAACWNKVFKQRGLIES